MKIKGYLTKMENDEKRNYKDSFQNTKLDILIASSNSMADLNEKRGKSSINPKTGNERFGVGKESSQNNQGNILKSDNNLQKKINSNKISENTKKMLVKVYEIDLVPLTLSANSDKKQIISTQNEKNATMNNIYGVNQHTGRDLSTLEKDKKANFNRSSSVCSEKGSDLLANMNSTNYSNIKRNFSIIENIKRQGG